MPRLACQAPLLLATAALAVAACRARGATVPPTRTTRPGPLARRSADPQARRLQTLLFGAERTPRVPAPREVAALRAWMTPDLRARFDADDVRDLLARLRTRYGHPRAVVEERSHREPGGLLWYTGLSLHGARHRREPQHLLLTRFALDARGRLAHLTVREHWFVQELRHPARDYRPANRFLFVSTGEWTVLHGGPTRATNYHHGSRTQRWAYDFVVKVGGRVRPRGRKHNQDYYGYGRPVLAPAPGVVVRAVDGVAENVPGTKGRAGGNGVVIDHGFGEYSSLWHGIPGTLRVAVGDRVEAGQELFLVGNSGASTLPHIHFHVWAKGIGGPLGLPAPLSDVVVDGRWYPARMPVRGERVRATRRGKPLARRPRVLVDL